MGLEARRARHHRRLLESASLEQIDRALDVPDSMQPMNTQNEFWTRHELPFDPNAARQVNAAMNDLIENRRPDAVVAATFLDLKTGNTNSRERDRQASTRRPTTRWASPCPTTGTVKCGLSA